MRLAIAAIAAISLAAALSACGGGGDGGPGVRLLLEADLSELPAEVDRDAVMNSVADILERRATSFGISGVKVERRDSSQISVVLEGVILEEDARELMERRAFLELRQPVLSENGEIVCEAADGGQFSILAEQLTYAAAVPDGPALPQCERDGEPNGTIVWETAITDESQSAAIDAVVIQPSSARVERTETPVVVLSFTPEGTSLLQRIAVRLVRQPMGIFVDGELLAGPTVQEATATEVLVIAGLSLPEANLLAAALNGGVLPVPLTVTSSEESS